jgi:hypothetical protein
MKFADFVSYTKEIGKLDTDLLVVVPSLASPEALLEHLDCLSKQSFQYFNLLLVLGEPFDDAALQSALHGRKFRFGIILAKENGRRGCSGAYFAGQKYAIEQGYKSIIMGDDDCMPLDPGLIENLYKNRGKGWVAPAIRFVADGYKKSGFLAAPYSYSLFSTEILKKYGLTYLPMFHGADDGELTERIREVPFRISNYAEHPYNLSGHRLFHFFDRSWLFLLHSLIILKSPRGFAYNLAQFGLLMSLCLFFLPKYGPRLFFIMTRLLLSYTYGKRAHDQIRSGYQDFVFPESEISAPEFVRINDTDPSYIDSPMAKRLSDALKSAAANLRRKVLVVNTYSLIKAFLIAATAKKAYVNIGGGKCLLLSDNSSPAAHFAKLILFIPFLAVYTLAISVVFIPVKILKQPNTMRYGLD